MTADRHAAWTRAIQQIERLGTGKLHKDEEAVLRNAASDLLLIDDVEGDEARALKQAAASQLDDLVEAGRIIPETREAILTEILACGYQAPALV